MEAWFHRMTTSSNLQLSDDFLTVSFQHPGLAYSMLDRDNKPSVTSLLFMCYAARSVAIRGRNESGQYILDWDWTQEQRLEFVVSSELDVEQDFYTKVDLMQPLLCQFTVLDAGRTSMVTQVTFYTTQGSNPVLTLVQRTVSIDAATRKPEAYPSRVLQRIKRADRGKELKLRPLGRFERPPKTFVHNVMVTWSDTDGYNHCNFTSYPRFLVDAIHSALRTDTPQSKHNGTLSSQSNESPQASPTTVTEVFPETVKNTTPGNQDSCCSCYRVKSNQRRLVNEPYRSRRFENIQTESDQKSSHSGEQCISEESLKSCGGNGCISSVAERGNNPFAPANFFLKNISDDVIRRGVKSFKIRYFKECLEGQWLDVHIWQDEVKDAVIYSSIERGRDVICQIRVEYFHTFSKL